MVSPPTPKAELEMGRLSASFQEVARVLNSHFLDKQEIIRLLLVSAIAGEHMVIVGPPGTAKSALIRMFARLIDARYFEYLLTRFTEPNELFGPVNIKEFREGRYVRRTENMLPEAEIVFLDEIFKSNSAILNSLLTIVNERRFTSGPTVREVPLLSLYAASNEVPNDENLAAMFDRFLLRVVSQNLDSYHFHELLARGVSNELAKMSGVDAQIRPIISAANLRQLQRNFERFMVFPDDFMAKYKGLIFQIRSEGITVSDRRAVKLLKLCAASAAFDGRTRVTDGDFFVLRHIWNNLDQAELLEEIVNPLVDMYYREHPDERRFIGPQASLEDLLSELTLIRELLTSGQNLSDIQLFSQLKNLNEIKAALATLSNDTATRMIREVDQLLESVFASSKFGAKLALMDALADKRSYLSRQVGTLALSQVRIDSPLSVLRAAVWFNAMARLGNFPPLFVVHDLGTLLTAQRGATGWSAGGDEKILGRLQLSAAQRSILGRYVDMIEMLASSEVVQRLAGWRIRDDLIAVLLTRALRDVCRSWRSPLKPVAANVELPVDIRSYENRELATMYSEWDARPLWDFLELLVDRALHVYTTIELIDLETVRLLGIFPEDSANGADRLTRGLDVVNLFAALGSPEASDVANFSLDLLPSILETKRASGSQSFSVDGYSSIERAGHVDSLMLSELAYEQEVFEQKIVDHELFYYGHEREREDERRLQYILVDASASMRGKRQVFGRGLALALAKKMALQGDEVWFRFFDSRLHELFKTSRGAPFPVPYLLSFRSEHGRNYTKVFQQLVVELTRLRREQKRPIVLHLITHGQCHIPPELAAALAQHCYLYGIIILPSSDVTPDFLPMLHRHQIVESSDLSSRSDRRERALRIVSDASNKKPDVAPILSVPPARAG